MRTLIVLALLLLSFVPLAEAASLPDHIRRVTLDPLFASPSVVAEINTIAGLRGNLWTRVLLVPRGYMKEHEAESTRSDEAARFEYSIAPEGRPHITVKDQIVRVVVGRRVLKSIDFANTWKEGVTQYWAGRFSYFIEPSLAGLSRLGPYTGQLQAMKHPSQPNWIGGAKWNDPDADAYAPWLKSEWKKRVQQLDLTGAWTGTSIQSVDFRQQPPVQVELVIQQRDQRITGTMKTGPNWFYFETTHPCVRTGCTWELGGAELDLDAFRLSFEPTHNRRSTSPYFLDIGLADQGRMLGGGLSLRRSGPASR